MLPRFDAPEISSILLLLIGVFMLIFKSHRKKAAILLLASLLGVFGCSLAIDYEQNNLYPIENKYVTLEGYISDLPTAYDDLYTYKLTLTNAEYLGNTYKANQTVRISSYEKLEFGDTVTVKGFLKRFSDRNNSTDFNTRRYYQSRGIFYKLYARELERTELTINKVSLNYAVTALKNQLCKIIDTEFSGDDSAVLKAVSVGNKRFFSPEYKDILMKTGIIKFFYSAFFHTHFIIMLIGILFVRAKKSMRDAILAISMLLYAAVNSAAPVFAKSAFVILFTIIMLKRLGFSHNPDILAVTVLSICLANPLYCFDTGFIMSVSCSLMFYYFYDILIVKLRFLPIGRKFAAFYIITTFMLLPITAYLFDGISPYTNLLAPLFSVAVGLLLALIPLMAVCIKLFGSALLLKPVIHLLILPFIKLPYAVDALPLSFIYLKAPDMTLSAAIFASYYILYQFCTGGMKQRKNLIITAACLGLWCSIPVSYFQNLGKMDITFVNVDQGDGAVIDITGGETLLVDGGGKYEFSDYDAGENIFLPYLISKGYTKIDKAIVSHFHSDHVLGIIAAVKNLTVDEIIIPDADAENEYRLELERLAAEKNIPIRIVSAGDVIDLGSGTKITIISSASPDSPNSNEGSIVMKLQHNGFNCLFTGDIGIETEAKIKDKIGDCDVVKMAHHGSASSNSEEFANAVTAEYAVVSVGESNIYAFPKEEAIINYQQSGARVIRTDVNGDITVSVQTDGSYSIFKNSY